MTIDEPFRSYGDARVVWDKGSGDRVRWFPQLVAGLGEKELLSRLEALGVGAARERVIEETADMVAGWELGEAWCALARASQDLDRDDEDLIKIGAVQLWMRLLPDRPCLELIDDWIGEGQAAFATDGERTAGAAVEVWQRALGWLKKLHITPDMTTTAELARRFPSSQDLGGWLAEMAEAYRWATVSSVARGQDGLAFCEWALATWTNEDLSVPALSEGALLT